MKSITTEQLEEIHLALQACKYFNTPIMRRRFMNDEYYDDACRRLRLALEIFEGKL